MNDVGHRRERSVRVATETSRRTRTTRAVARNRNSRERNQGLGLVIFEEPAQYSKQNVQCSHEIFLILQHQKDAMKLNDFLDAELCKDNLKMSNQAWEETLLALGNDLDEHVLENLYERQVKKSTLMKHAMEFFQTLF